MGDLAEDTRVQGADGRYIATLSRDWHIWGPAGGYIAAVALRAAGEYSAFPRPASLTCHFLGVGDYRDVDIDVRTLRRAKRAESLGISILQDGRPLLEAVAWVIGDVDGLEHDHATMPHVPPPDELKSIEELLTPEQLAQGPPYPFWLNFEERPMSWLQPEEWENRPAGDPTFRNWMSFRPTATFDDPFIEAARQLITLDVAMWPAASHAYARDELTHIAPSLDLSAVFHRIRGMGQWLMVDGYSPTAGDGIVGGTARVWSQDGRLLGSALQSMLCRPAPVP